MGLKCNFCMNKGHCSECDPVWKDQFVPSGEVKKYFHEGYNGVRGHKGRTWDFDSTEESLKPTHSIRIGSKHYCPYCGEEMYPIQDKETFDVTGHCCICQGARDELEYEARKQELEETYQRKLESLRNEYREKLAFCTESLFEIKQRQERERFQFFSHEYNHFSTLNGKNYEKIEQMV